MSLYNFGFAEEEVCLFDSIDRPVWKLQNHNLNFILSMLTSFFVLHETSSINNSKDENDFWVRNLFQKGKKSFT